MPLTDDDVKALAEYVHSVVFTAQPQGAPPAGATVALNLLVGNARDGERYFRRNARPATRQRGIWPASAHAARTSSSCRTAGWPGAGGRRRLAAGMRTRRRAQHRRVTVKLAGGETASTARCCAWMNSCVSLRTDAGDYRSFTRRGTPRIESIAVDDPLRGHRPLWTKLSNKTMHDVTAYLARLK